MNEMLKYNKEFVEKREYEKYKTTKYPEKKNSNINMYGY